jgi:hypothetical protein
LTTIKTISLLCLGLWLGAAIFFSVVVAPAAFSVLRHYQIANAPEIAGAIVNRSLSVVNTGGFVVGLLALLAIIVLRRHYGSISFLLQALSIATMTLLTGVGQWVIAAKIRALRAGLALPIDQLALDDPRRLAFNRWHSYSVSALAIAMIAALIAYILLARIPRQG